jgi:hypothetical protein
LERWADQLNAVFCGGGLERLSLIGGRRAGGGRQLGALGWTTHSTHEALEIPAGGDRKAASPRRGLNAVGMSDAFGRKEKIAGAKTMLLVADLNAELAIKNLKDLVLGAVHMQRWGEAVRHVVF